MEDEDKNPPAPNLDVHTLDLEFWPNLDIGNEFLHVDWLEDVRHPEAPLGHNAHLGSHTHAHTSKDSVSLDDAIGDLEGLEDALAVGGNTAPSLGVDAMLDGIEDDLDFLGAKGESGATRGVGVAKVTPRAPDAINYDIPQNLSSKSTTTAKSSGQKNKRRLRWTPELHSLFVEAVQHLKGPEKATPKGIMLYMKVDGLTTFHIKSHLQKYRMNCSQAKADAKMVTNVGFQQGTEGAGEAEEAGEAEGTNNSGPGSATKNHIVGLSAAPPSTSVSDTERESHHCRIEQALLVQMQMQKRLQEQLEEQRKLQLSIQAQEQHIRQLKEELQRSEADDHAPRRKNPDDHRNRQHE